MLKVNEIKAAIELLSERELSRLRKWFYERDWDRWDNQIREDSQSGRLDFLTKEADEARRKGQLKEL